MTSLHSLLIKCKSVSSRNKQLKEKELLKTMKTIKKTMHLQRREPKGIGDIKFTVGLKETKSFQAENESRRAGGDSYFVRVKKVSSSAKLSRASCSTRTRHIRNISHHHRFSLSSGPWFEE